MAERDGSTIDAAWNAPRSSWSPASPAYLAHLLRAAIVGPGADAEPAAARLAADVLVALAEAGAAAEGEWALATRPGAPAVYEVRSFASGSLEPADPFGTADPDEAILATRDRSLEAGRAVELLSRDATGLQRCVLSQTPGGLRYRFPELACIDAPDAAAGVVAAAVEEWRVALLPATRVGAPPTAPPEAVAQAVLDLLVADGRALRTYDVADVLASLIPTAADVADLVVERLVVHFEGDATD